MKLPRRQFIRIAAGAVALPTVPHIAWAQTYPSRPVTIIVPFPAGGAVDITARLIGQWLSERLGQQFIIETRPGAGGNIGTEVVVRAPADGYTLLMVDASVAINATLYDKLNFNFLRDIAPVASISRAPNVMVVNPSVPAGTVPEFIAYAKANPGKMNMASSGNGTPPHIAGELFKMMTGINLVHVPYRGAAPAIIDLLAGHVQVTFTAVVNVIEYVKAGKLRALAMTTATRLQALPDVPTVSDFVPGYEATSAMVLVRPKTRPSRLSTSSTRKSLRALPIRRYVPGLPIWAPWYWRWCPPPTLQNLLLKKPRSGAR
jgi:tripartite-type tricarboxylate transporter receptor subunit TctC